MGQPNPTAVNLLVDGKVVATATGTQQRRHELGVLERHDSTRASRPRSRSWTRTTDGGWGHINVDDIVFSAQRRGALQHRDRRQPARRRPGRPHRHRRRTARTLDWASWDVQRPHRASRRRSRSSTTTPAAGGTSTPTSSCSPTRPALSSIQRAHWVDYGADFYAANTFNDAPGGRRIMIAWMNNWNYGRQHPHLAVAQRRHLPAPALAARPSTARCSWSNSRSANWTSCAPAPGDRGPRTPVSGHNSRSASAERRWRSRPTSPPGNAKPLRPQRPRRRRPAHPDRLRHHHRRGLHRPHQVRRRRASTPHSPACRRAPLPLDHGRLRLHILVDASSVEVFADQGRRWSLTDQIFPDADSTGVSVFADGGTATLDHLEGVAPTVHLAVTKRVGKAIPTTIS